VAESIRNIQFVCPKHAPVPNPELGKKPREFFVGKFCKLTFKVRSGRKTLYEHMWVRRTDLAGGSKVKLIGELNNHPIIPEIAARWRIGDTRVFTPKDIIEVLNDLDNN